MLSERILILKANSVANVASVVKIILNGWLVRHRNMETVTRTATPHFGEIEAGNAGRLLDSAEVDDRTRTYVESTQWEDCES